MNQGDVVARELASRRGLPPLSRCVIAADVLALELRAGHRAGPAKTEVGAEDVEIGFQPDTDRWARDVVLEAWIAEHPGLEPGLAEIQAMQAIGRHEGAYGLATKPPQWKGSNNWGAIQCKKGPPCDEGCFQAPDSHLDGTPYEWCYAKYASAVAGARALIRLVTKRRPTVWEAMRAGDADGIGREMLDTRYNETPGPRYAGNVARNAREIAEAIGEPWVVRRAEDGPAFPEIPPLVDPQPENDNATGLELVVGMGLLAWWGLRA